MKLGELANVRSGLVLGRKKAADILGYSYPLLTFRSLNPSGYIEKKNLEEFTSTELLSPDYLSREGDIIVRLTSPYTAVLIDKDSENIVISSNFVIIRVKDKRLNAGYLWWLLNTKRIKYRIYENSTSNMLSAVNAGFFNDFNIKMLPKETQEQISQMNILSLKETCLLKRLSEEKEKYYSYVIENLQKEVIKNDN